TDPQRHIQRRDEAEATTALIIPTVIVRIERQAPAHFLDAARKFLARDDAASSDGARAHLFADAHAAPLRARDCCHSRLARTVTPKRRGDSIVTVGASGPSRIRLPVRSLIRLSWHHSTKVKTWSSARLVSGASSASTRLRMGVFCPRLNCLLCCLVARRGRCRPVSPDATART